MFVLFIRPPIFSALLLGHTLLLSAFAPLCKLLLAPPAIIISVKPMAPGPNLKAPLWTVEVSGVESYISLSYLYLSISLVYLIYSFCIVYILFCIPRGLSLVCLCIGTLGVVTRCFLTL